MTGKGADGRSDNETTQMWREAREQQQAHRERVQLSQEAQLAKAVAAGLLDAVQMSEYHWRVWHPSNVHRALDFWPRTQRAREVQATGSAWHCRVQELLVWLTPTGR